MKTNIIIAIMFLLIGILTQTLFIKKHWMYDAMESVKKRGEYIKTHQGFGGYCTSSNTEILKNGFSYCLRRIRLEKISYYPGIVRAIYRGDTKNKKIICELTLSLENPEVKTRDYCNLTTFYKKDNIKIGNARQYMIDRKREAEKSTKK